MVLAAQAANNFTSEKHVVIIDMLLGLQKFTTHGQKKKGSTKQLQKAKVGNVTLADNFWLT